MILGLLVYLFTSGLSKTQKGLGPARKVTGSFPCGTVTS